jgi:hypothetical protein
MRSTPAPTHTKAFPKESGTCPAVASFQAKYAPNGIASHVMPMSQLTPLGFMPIVSLLNHFPDQCSNSPMSRNKVTPRLIRLGIHINRKMVMRSAAASFLIDFYPVVKIESQ